MLEGYPQNLNMTMEEKIIIKDVLSKFVDKEKLILPKKGFSIPLKKLDNNDLKDEIKLSLSSEFFIFTALF